MFEDAKRPIFLLGGGIKSADLANKLVSTLGIPALTTWAGIDLLDHENPYFAGRPGVFGSRYANLAVQNADLLVTIGARWDLATTGFNLENFGKGRRIAVDIDQNELDKLPANVGKLCQDADLFIFSLLNQSWNKGRYAPWVKQIQDWKRLYPITGTGTYAFIDHLSNELRSDDVIVCGSAGIYSEIFFQAFKVKLGQRIIGDHCMGAMGYGLPAAIGACLASGRRTILVDGDGSIMPNIQELETIRRLQLPIKIFVICNGGYASIRQSQDRWFGRRIASDEASGMPAPDIAKIASAFGVDLTLVHVPQGEERLRLKSRMVYGKMVTEPLETI